MAERRRREHQSAVEGLQLERQRIVQVPQDQQAPLRGPMANDRVFVEGAPGSGKTLLATEFAVAA